MIYFYLGSPALQRDLKSSTNRVFAALCLSLVLWSFSYAFIYGGSLEEISLVFFWYRISSIGWIVFPAFILLFGLVLTKKEKKMTKNSWLCTIKPGDIDWNQIFKVTKLFHVCGTAPAISASTAETTEESL